MPQEPIVNFTGGLQAVDNPGVGTNVSIATSVPNAHTFTGNLTFDGNLTASAGARNFNFASSTGTFDTSTGQVTLNGNTQTASGKTITSGLGVDTADAVTIGTSTTTGHALNITTGGGITSGGAVNIDTGISAGTSTTSGFGLNITGSGAFAGTGNNASLVRVQSTGNFSGTLVKLVADNTQTGTILGISGTSLTRGKAIDVALGAAYFGQTDAGGDIGAVNVRAGAFTGNIFSVSATATGAGATSNLANLSSPQGDGRLLFVNATGDYLGAGALNVTLNPSSTNAIGGTAVAVNTLANFAGSAIDFQAGLVSRFKVTSKGAIVVNAPSGFVGNLEELKVNGGSVSSVDQTGKLTNSGGIATSGDIVQSGTTTLATGTGGVTLNGNTTLSANNSFTQTGSGTFATGTGAVGLNGNTTVATGQTFTASQGVTAGTGSSFATATGITSGQLVSIDTGTSTFSTPTGGGLNITSTGLFTGSLQRLVANTTTAGTVLGIDSTALTTGSAFTVNLGVAAYTGSGVIAVTANSATSGTLVNLSGTAIGVGNGTGVKIAIGTSTGVDPSVGKGLQIALGTVGTGYYANAATGYSGNFIDLRVNALPVFSVNQAGSVSAGTLTTTGLTVNGTSTFNGNVTVSANNNFIQNGTGTFGTGTGAVSLNGATTLSANFSQTGATTFSTGSGAVSLNGVTTIGVGDTLTIGSSTNNAAATVVSTPITAHFSTTTAFNLASVTGGTCANQTGISVPGAKPGDTVIVTPTAVASGAETLNMGWFGWVAANDSVTIRFCAFATSNPGNETWRIDVWRH